MMQVSLTTAESKWLISKAVMEIGYFREALKNGKVLIHPSSTTYFLFREITGEFPDNWVCGVITPKGACISRDMLEMLDFSGNRISRFPFWYFERGKLVEGLSLDDIIEQLDERSVYVKAGNAIDPAGNVGVLVGAPDGRGTVGRIYEESKVRGFKVIIPIGLEKLVPSVIKASRVADPRKVRYSFGIPLRLFPIKGQVVTEIEAVELLSKCKAHIIAGGGLKGAEGGVTIVIEGEDRNLKKLKEIFLSIKGAKLPDFEVSSCDECSWKTCHIYNFENLSRLFENL